jgi:hypothetical protein
VSTSYSSTLRYESNTYDIGSASTIIIQDPGRYEIATTDNENFMSLNSNVTGQTVTQVAVYDYTQADTTEQKIQAGDKQTQDQFGYSVSISGDYAIVGASGKDTSKGAAYMYTRNGTSWGSEQKIQASDGSGAVPNVTVGDKFGQSISLSGDYAIVGAPTDTINHTYNGSAYVYTRDPSTGQWGGVQKLTAYDKAQNDRFGSSVSISGDYAFVGNLQINRNDSSGSVYIFTRNGTTWGYDQKIQANDKAQGDNFGRSVSISGDYAIVGASSKDTSKGAAYIYTRSGTTWTQQANFAGEATQDNFGFSVSISGDYAIVGAQRGDADVADTGAAYIFKKTTTTLSGVRNPYFTDASTIVTDSNWSSSTGFEITVSSVGASQPGYQAFDNIYTAANSYESTWLSAASSGMPAWVQIQYPQDVVIQSYTIVGRDDTDRYYPTSWQLQGATATKTSIAITSGIYYTNYTGCYYELDSSQNTENSRFFELKASDGTPQFGTPELYGFEVRRSGTTYTAYANTGGNSDEPNELSITSIGSGLAASVVLPTTGSLYGQKQTNYGTFGTESVTWSDVFETYVNLETTSGNRTASSWAPLAEVSYDVNTPGTAYRYFRLYVNSSNEGGQVSINELKLYTTPLSGQSVTVDESWSEQQKLTASDAAASDQFGLSVSIDGDYAIVGALVGDSTIATDSGAAYIFKRDGTTWSEIKKLTASDSAASDYFGGSIAIDGTYAIVGAQGEDSSTGAAYIYEAPNLASTLAYDGLNTLVLSNVSTGSYNTFLEGSNVLACATDLTTYPVPKSGITGTFTYSARTKSDSVYAFTNDVSITDYYKTYQYPPIDGTTTGLTSSTTSATWTISGVQYSTESSVAGSPYNTFDNSITSGFDSTSSTGDITITFESAKTIRKYIVWPYDSTAPVSTPGGSTDPFLSTDGTFRPKSWTLYGYTDSTGWVSLDTVTNQPPSIYGDVHSISSPASYLYYKLSVTANNGGSGLKIGEWQLWGDA